MFWGLIMEPGRCYTQTVTAAFHVSMAALDISTSGEEPAQVMCVFEGRNYLLCTLNKENTVQCALDLNFEVGTKVSFATNGKSHVHLTGYLINFGAEEVEEEEDVEEEEAKVVSVKDKKKKDKAELGGPPSKKSKLALLSETLEDEDDMEDSDYDINKALNETESGDEEESAEDAEEEDEDDDDDDNSSLSLDEEFTEEVIEKKTKQNGIAKSSSTPKPVPKQMPKKIPEEKTPRKDKEGKTLKKTKDDKAGKQPESSSKNKGKRIMKKGVIVQDLKEGTGDMASAGKFLHVYYEGRLKDNNKLFDSTNKGPGFSFRLGKGEVIKGWDIGLEGMRVGGKRQIICPASVAYGAKGSPPVIPPNSTLIFEVELKKIS